MLQMLELLRKEEGAHEEELSVLKLNNDDFILKTCELWANRLIAAGKQYCRVLVITEDSGMLAKAKHDGKVSAIRVKELPTSHDALKELIFDKDLLERLPVVNHQQSAPDPFPEQGKPSTPSQGISFSLMMRPAWDGAVLLGANLLKEPFG